MSFNEVAIRVTNLSKRFEIYDTPRDRLKQFIMPGIRRMAGKANKQYFREFWALKNVSFEINKGETFGIIGRNGAGKSTLLQILCGTLTTTSGSIESNGRVAALLELGAGFNPEFTGRENVYMNAAVLGLSREEVDERFDNIAAFSDIGDFIEQPVKTYSSGMYVRLAFAVIAHVDADILIIDEALAVGDVFFQQKCMRYLREHKNNGGTIVFVSHDTSAVIGLCDKAILLSGGENAFVGESDKACRMYIEDIYAERIPLKVENHSATIEPPTNQLMSQQSSESISEIFKGGTQSENLFRVTPFRHDVDSFGRGGVKIADVWFEDASGSRVVAVHGGDSVNFCIRVDACQNIQWPAFGFMLKDRLGQYVIAEGTDLAFRHHSLELNKGDTAQVKFSFIMPILIQGEYSLNVAVAGGIGDDHIQQHWINDAIVLHSLKSRLVQGICGLENLNMEIQITSAYQSKSR